MKISIAGSKVTVLQMKIKIEKALDVLRKREVGMRAGKDNPSVSKNYYHLVGEINALEAVHDALKGDNINLNILSTK